ncbi:aldehyde dehydrogenase family protein [Limimaricola pyoseonensis]|uniref:Aldehyde dehydrogenase n=1 Tax=Limimaricola pyoseonensis TaxID=521013 RepID=A0A1G7FVX3_9RHOB|nr:aldehyde dehydrogenase family protein [Limimaricola pyoseonensis]SDE80040.1 coniferyl-aldehyde dehydrogenase [Limimaricola pyoseonensis]
MKDINDATGVGPALAALRAAAPDPDRAARDAHLAALAREVRAHAEEIAQAIDADFGGRPRPETMLAEVGLVLESLRHARRNLKRWMRPGRVRLPPHLWPSRGRVLHEPLGVVGILAPWNYPFQLALQPLVAALAGGNRVLLHPSEHMPRTGALIARIVADAVPERVRVLDGGPEQAQAIAAAPLDGLFFTGSTATGRKVARAAAENLVPVVLELGGKSPALLMPDADLDEAAASIVAGKLLNAGQTCIAPDYALVPRDRMDDFVAALKRATARLYPDPDGPDYAAILRETDRARLAGLLEGARAEPLMARMPAAPRMGAWALIDPAPDHPAMQDEIFGPVLPVLAYDAPAAARDFVNARPTPLALYVYGSDVAAAEAEVAAIRSGGAMINEAVLHVAVQELPFGGAGESGMGAYHGDEGFRAFTRPRSVVVARRSLARLARPPYGRAVERVIASLLR